MRAIVTGGAGFVGSHLCRRLMKDGWSVLAIDNLSSGHARNLPPGCEFKWLDLTDEDSETVLPKEGADVVFHLASHVGQELSPSGSTPPACVFSTSMAQDRTCRT